jgi:hypothetical protein
MGKMHLFKQLIIKQQNGDCNSLHNKGTTLRRAFVPKALNSANQTV